MTQQAGIAVSVTDSAWNGQDYCFGGSNGGMLGTDLSGDGWPDLYMGVWRDRNRLFLGGPEGVFRDETRGDVNDSGDAFGAAAGDVDNDGDLDLFQAGGGGARSSRSLLLINLGDGHLIDATEGSGLGAVNQQSLGVLGAVFLDLDNDGDLDLVTGNPHFLFLNEGGMFADATDQSGLLATQSSLSVGDANRDGFADLATTLPGRLYVNRGGGNRWLQVELVGTESVRYGIGARVECVTGALRQVRQILGGQGYVQNEMIAHFGLGRADRVDTVRVHWPSGRVDEHLDLATNQRVRLFEGHRQVFAVQPSTWAIDTDSIAAGTSVQFHAVFRPASFDATATFTSATADISSIGGASSVPLTPAAGGFTLDEQLEVAVPVGRHTIPVLFEQSTLAGSQWIQLRPHVDVLPASDLIVHDDGLAPGWEATPLWTAAFDPDARVAGEDLRSLSVSGSSTFGLRLALEESSAQTLFGYTEVRFRFRPSDIEDAYLTLRVGFEEKVLWREGSSENLVDLAVGEWQNVTVPIADTDDPVALQFGGQMSGTYHLSDVRFVSAYPSTSTAVVDTRQASAPVGFALSQNYPNPFNPKTTISFDLTHEAAVDLGVYNIGGQRVAELVPGVRPVGHHTVHWEGQDDAGRQLASGLYLYRLEAGGRAKTRKLMLLR